MRAVSKAEFSEVYNVEGGIHAYATQVNPAVGTY
jgi:rhodanese-related sulfurtransferase